MGFFSGFGKKIKKFVKKNVRLKNIVKLGASFDPTGIIGGIQDAHYAKKAEREAMKQAEQENADFVKMSNTEKVDAVNSQLSKGSKFMDVLNGFLGGGMHGAGTVLAGDTNVANAGATLADNTIMAYLKQNWAKLLGFVAVGTLFIVGIVKLLKPKKKGWR